MSVRCCNKAHNPVASEGNIHHHDSVAQVRLCSTVRLVESHEEAEYMLNNDLHARMDYEDEYYADQYDAAYEAEMAYERFLETRWSEEFRADEQREMMQGLISYEQARDLAARVA